MVKFKKNNKGVSLIEALVCLVVLSIGVISILQLSAFAISSMDRSIEKNKLNFLAVMFIEDMIGDSTNITNYDGFNQSNCNYYNRNGTKLHEIKKDKWRNKLSEKSYKKIEGKYKKPTCNSTDSKKTFVKSQTINGNHNFTSGRVNFYTGKIKKYLGVTIK